MWRSSTKGTLCFHFVCCTEKVNELINHPVVSLLDTQWTVQVQRWSPRVSIWNVLQPHSCYTTDSPCNNRVDLPTPLLRQRDWKNRGRVYFQRDLPLKWILLNLPWITPKLLHKFPSTTTWYQSCPNSQYPPIQTYPIPKTPQSWSTNHGLLTTYYTDWTYSATPCLHFTTSPWKPRMKTHPWSQYISTSQTVTL